MKEIVVKEVVLPENIEAEVKGNKIHLKGTLGNAEREFLIESIVIQKADKKIIVKCGKATKREKKLIGTIVAHIKNMIKGLETPFEYKLQICSVHFPISASVNLSKDLVIIKNFLGETNERRAKILPNVDVKIHHDIITVTSTDKEAAAQTAANMETATKIKSRDRRIFQDGIFITEKPGKKI